MSQIQVLEIILRKVFSLGEHRQVLLPSSISSQEGQKSFSWNLKKRGKKYKVYKFLSMLLLFYHRYWKSAGPEIFLAQKPIRWHFKIQPWEAINDFIPFFFLTVTLSVLHGSQPPAFQPTLKPATCLFRHTKDPDFPLISTTRSQLTTYAWKNPTQAVQRTLPWASQRSWFSLQILSQGCKAKTKWVSEPPYTLFWALFAGRSSYWL